MTSSRSIAREITGELAGRQPCGLSVMARGATRGSEAKLTISLAHEIVLGTVASKDVLEDEKDVRAFHSSSRMKYSPLDAINPKPMVFLVGANGATNFPAHDPIGRTGRCAPAP